MQPLGTSVARTHPAFGQKGKRELTTHEMLDALMHMGSKNLAEQGIESSSNHGRIIHSLVLNPNQTLEKLAEDFGATTERIKQIIQGTYRTLTNQR